MLSCRPEAFSGRRRANGEIVDVELNPVPGIPIVRVSRPDAVRVMRAPGTPTEVLTPLGLMVIRTPGTTLNDFR